MKAGNTDGETLQRIVALREHTCYQALTEAGVVAFLEGKYRLDHAIGAATRERLGPSSRRVASDCVVYGVMIRNLSRSVYIGETSDARRRLFDLAIGESHHLANTFPTFLWTKIIVIRWPSLMIEAELAMVAKELGGADGAHVLKLAGAALEHCLQQAHRPVFNVYKKSTTGLLRARALERSGRKAASLSQLIPRSYERVAKAWQQAEACESHTAPATTLPGGHGFVIHPQVILESTLSGLNNRR